jgi:hypothetical protein
MSGPKRFQIFSIYPKLAGLQKIKMDILPCFKNSEFLHVAWAGYYKQFSQLCRHQILNTNRVKNPVTDSTFEFLMNFKGIYTF